MFHVHILYGALAQEVHIGKLQMMSRKCVYKGEANSFLTVSVAVCLHPVELELYEWRSC